MAPADHLMSKLRDVYAHRGLAQEFEEERPVYEILIPRLQTELEHGFEELSPFKTGSTASVWVVVDRALRQKRVLKFPRPRLSKLRKILRIIRAERERMAALNHQNIIKIFSAGELELEYGSEKYMFPYFIMEYLDGVQDFDAYIEDAAVPLSSVQVAEYFRDILAGVEYLHSQDIIHCDLKPGNILIAPGRPALIADFGYAKHLPRETAPDTAVTGVTVTRHYAHPDLKRRIQEYSSDSNAQEISIPTGELRVAFDLFALGRTFLYVLQCLQRREGKYHHLGERLTPILAPYQRLFLAFVSKRLLDGQVEERNKGELETDVIPGLPDSAMKELCYALSSDALTDVEKLLNLYDLEREIPELNPHLSTYIQIPGQQVPITSRVEKLINHPTVARLSQVSQLGFVSLLYPGACHTRFEHVLGTFAHCCGYVRALWYDSSNCLFQCLLRRADIELILASALLHDIAQYPMAHDLAEVASEFAHERYTRQMLEHTEPGTEGSVGDILRTEWGIDTEQLLGVLNATEQSSVRERLLKSIISGPLDCDKLDYLKRDCVHTGVKFGAAIDEERLLRNLTIVYSSTTRHERRSVDGAMVPKEVLEVIGIGTREKALVIAESLWRVRRDMFRQVYWHHTVRTLKAMLGFAVREMPTDLSSDELETFWDDFVKSLLLLRVSCGDIADEPRRDGHGAAEWGMTSDGDAMELGSMFVETETELPERVILSSGQLTRTDASVLALIWRHTTTRAQRVMERIVRRRLFSRYVVISHDKDSQVYDSIYQECRTYRLAGKHSELESRRQAWEDSIKSRAYENIEQSGMPTLEKERAETLIRAADPLILVDVPIKALSRPSGERLPDGAGLLYLPESHEGSRNLETQAFPRFERAQVLLEQEQFDKSVGKIRVLVAPEVKELLTSLVSEEAARNIIATV